jgi:hypothetical protein
MPVGSIVPGDPSRDRPLGSAMSADAPGRTRNRLSRIAKKKVPHRSDHRFFAAKAHVRSEFENLQHDLRHSCAHPPVIADFLHALESVDGVLHDLAPSDPGAKDEVRELTKLVQHLRLAETWVTASERVLMRLGGHATAEQRIQVEEARETVMWCVRAGHWDGQLTAAIGSLQPVVLEAEARAALVAV